MLQCSLCQMQLGYNMKQKKLVINIFEFVDELHELLNMKKLWMDVVLGEGVKCNGKYPLPWSHSHQIGQ
jgi:hypothetical protein